MNCSYGGSSVDLLFKCPFLHASNDISRPRRLLLLLLLHYVDHKRTAQQYRRLLDTMVLVTVHPLALCHSRYRKADSPQGPHTTRLQDQTRIILQPLPNPPRRKTPQYMPMRHNQHIIREATLALPTRLLPKPALMPLLPDLRNQRIQPLRDILRALAALAAVAPYVPVPIQSALCPRLADLRGREALVVAVVPLADRGTYGYGGVCADVEGRMRGFRWGFLVPGVALAAADVEEFEGALGAVAGGYVAGSPMQVSMLGRVEEHGVWRGRGRGTHVCEVARDDQSVVADEGFACGADALLAVGG